jgi:very-short-patch-repair endonuclease
VDLIWETWGIEKPQTEYKFHPIRKWRFDYAWLDRKIAVEIEGGIWIRGASGRGGAHSLPSNIIRDMEKSNAAQALGWRVFRFTPQQLKTGEAQNFMMRVFKSPIQEA